MTFCNYQKRSYVYIATIYFDYKFVCQFWDIATTVWCNYLMRENIDEINKFLPEHILLALVATACH